MELKLSISEELTPISMEKIAALLLPFKKKTVRFPGRREERPIPGIMSKARWV